MQSVHASADKHVPPPSTRELVADDAFCGLLATDLEIKPTTARTVFLGEPKVRCIRVTEWALRNEPDDPERRAKILIWWAKKKQAGAFSERATDFTGAAMPAMKNGSGEERENEVLARHILDYWTANPMRFVAVLDEVEAHATGKNGGRR